MIITPEEQEQLIFNYFEDKQYTSETYSVFISGMFAMMSLVDKKLTAERKALQPEQPQIKD